MPTCLSKSVTYVLELVLPMWWYFSVTHVLESHQFNYPGKMVSLRNDKFVPALDCIYGNDCFGNRELHRQLLKINNETNIFVNGKMKPIYTIRDYVENVRLK